MNIVGIKPILVGNPAWKKEEGAFSVWSPLMRKMCEPQAPAWPACTG